MTRQPRTCSASTSGTPDLLDTPDGRRVLTRLHPRLFALVYLRHHLAGDETHDTISFSEAHLDWYDQVLSWVKPATEPKGWRRGYVAPRASGKSTFWYLIAPMWAAAHGHVKFCAAFSDSASQAEGHLATFKRELDTNDLIRRDYPKLTMPLMRGSRGVSVADSRSLMVQRNHFVFAAKGVDSATLGMKVGERRPDLIILDDVEPVGSNYSAYLVREAAGHYPERDLAAQRMGACRAGRHGHDGRQPHPPAGEVCHLR